MATGEANVLITCAGRRVELVRAFQAARDALGLRGRILCADCNPTAPALASVAPYTSRETRAAMIAPAHIGQGSSVT